MMPSQLIKPPEASLILNAKPSTLAKARSTGLLFGNPAPTFIKQGKAVFYDPEVLHEWREKYLVSYTSTSQYDQ